VNSSQEVTNVKKLIRMFVEYITAIRIELERRRLVQEKGD
jgi:hypothetical protein